MLYRPAVSAGTRGVVSHANSSPLYFVRFFAHFFIPMPDKQNQFSTFWTELRSVLKPNIDYARLTAAEKLTMLLTMLSFSLLAFVLISLIMFFLSLAIVRCIASEIGMIWAYFIMCGFYVLLFALAFAFRKQLIINPIARFVSRLFFNP